MHVEVETPEEYAGNVMGDLSSRRGMVQGMEERLRQPDYPRRGAAGRDVRLLHHAALDVAGARHLHHGVPPLRGSAAQCGG